MELFAIWCPNFFNKSRSKVDLHFLVIFLYSSMFSAPLRAFKVKKDVQTEMSKPFNLWIVEKSCTYAVIIVLDSSAVSKAHAMYLCNMLCENGQVTCMPVCSANFSMLWKEDASLPHVAEAYGGHHAPIHALRCTGEDKIYFRSDPWIFPFLWS